MSKYFEILRNIVKYLVKFRSDSPVGDFGRLPLLVHLQGLLVRCLLHSCTRDALADLFVPDAKLSV